MAKTVIMVPNQKLPGYHQVKNAKAYEHAGAAVVVDDEEMYQNPEVLLTAIKKLIADPERRAELAANLRRFTRDDAAESLAKTVISVAKE